jgi:hypothetical protein
MLFSNYAKLFLHKLLKQITKLELENNFMSVRSNAQEIYLSLRLAKKLSEQNDTANDKEAFINNSNNSEISEKDVNSN